MNIISTAIRKYWTDKITTIGVNMLQSSRTMCINRQDHLGTIKFKILSVTISIFLQMKLFSVYIAKFTNSLQNSSVPTAALSTHMLHG